MTDHDLHERLRAVERRLTDADTAVAELSESAAVHERLDSLETDLEELTERLDALDATVQSLHGYVGELEHVNDRVERRADAARAAVERLDDAQLVQENPSNAGDTAPADQSTCGATDSTGTRSQPTTSARSDRTSACPTTEEPDVDTHSLLDTDDEDQPSADVPDEQSLLDRVRESL
jgi:uncharacterized coiled-coil protein SlyX